MCISDSHSESAMVYSDAIEDKIDLIMAEPVSYTHLLGMTRGTSIAVLNSKSRGVLIVKVRGTRFALGRNITKNILVG